MECPCRIDCPDRNGRCHMKGNCPHNYDKWAEENAIERENRWKAKKNQIATTAAKERRHFNYIKYGKGQTRR